MQTQTHRQRVTVGNDEDEKGGEGRQAKRGEWQSE